MNVILGETSMFQTNHENRFFSVPSFLTLFFFLWSVSPAWAAPTSKTEKKTGTKKTTEAESGADDLGKAKQESKRDSKTKPVKRLSTESKEQGEGKEQASDKNGEDLRIHVLFHGDLMGRYHWPGCGRVKKAKGHYGNLVGAVRDMRAEAKKAGDPEPVVVNGGNMMGPDIMGQFIFSKKQAEFGRKLLKLIKKADYDAVLVGRHDWSAPLEHLKAYLKKASSLGLNMLAGNVECKKKSDPRCVHLGCRKDSFAIIRRGPVKIAVFGVLKEDLAKNFILENAKGLEIKDPLKYLRKHIKKVRENLGADVVILMTDVDSADTAPKNVLELIRDLGKTAPDLVVANGLYNPSSKNADFISHIDRWRGSPIVATSRFGEHLGHAVLTLKKSAKGGFVVEKVESKHVPIEKHESEEEDTRLLETMMRALCKRVDIPLGSGKIEAPMSRKNFITYMLRIMMREGKAELAMLPDTLFADANFPIRGKLTLEKIYRAIRFTDPVGIIKVKGSWIKTTMEKYLNDHQKRLRLEGIEKKDKLYYVNDRLLMEEQHYRIVTTSFVAQGGGGLIEEQKSFTPLKNKRSLRQMAKNFFESNGHRKPGKEYEDRINVKTDFIPLNKRFLISSVLDANFSLNDVSIMNPGVYTDRTQLNRERITGLLFNMSFSLEAINHLHSLSATANIKYGKSRTWVTDELTGITTKSDAETDDLVSLYLLYKLMEMHRKYDPKKWFYPIPFIEGYIQTEITRDLISEEGKRYRFTETAGMTGPGFMPHPKVFMKVGFVLRSYNILIPKERQAELGLYGGFTLLRHPLVKIQDSPLYAESRLDIYFTQLRKKRIKEFIWTNKLSLSLISRLFLNITHEFYIYDTREHSVNLASNLTAGIQVYMDYRHQTF